MNNPPATGLLIYAHRKVTTLAEGQGWENEYPRDTWRLSRLGIDSAHATLQFSGISQPWLRSLAKRWTRWRLSAGLSAGACYHGVQAVTRFSAFLEQAGIRESRQAGREALERYLAALHVELAGKRTHRAHIGLVNTFLQAVRRHGWDASQLNRAICAWLVLRSARPRTSGSADERTYFSGWSGTRSFRMTS